MDYHKDTKRVRSGLREAFKILRRRGSAALAAEKVGFGGLCAFWRARKGGPPAPHAFVR
jgi:hypothetical protein